MANLGPHVPRTGHSMGANAPVLHTSAIPSLDHVLQSWEPALIRAAKAWGLSYDATQDLVQAARIALARALECDPGRPAPYLRRVITNAMRDEYRAKRLIDDPVMRGDDDDDEYIGLDVMDSAPIASERFFDADHVKRWIGTLPARLQALFELLYVQEMTQRSAAMTMGLSKTRVVQLNNELLLYAKTELIGLAA